MEISLDDLTVSFEHLDRETLLADWEWLIGPHRLPILITAVGDAFVQDTRDGTVHWLDTVFAELEQVAASDDELRALLGDREFVADRLGVQMFAALRAAGMELGPDQVFSLQVPPALGGEPTVENVGIVSLRVHFSLSGQLHRQLAELPEGAEITGFRIAEE